MREKAQEGDEAYLLQGLAALLLAAFLAFKSPESSIEENDIDSAFVIDFDSFLIPDEVVSSVCVMLWNGGG